MVKIEEKIYQNLLQTACTALLFFSLALFLLVGLHNNCGADWTTQG